MNLLENLLEQSMARHSHLCPRQVLGVRMALAGAELLGFELPRTDKSMIIITETDGCFLDGLEVATGLTPGHRTLRIVDYGKIAATFVDVKKGQAVRMAPLPDVRQQAYLFAPGETRHYFAQLQGYQLMPADIIFSATWVTLSPSADVIMSRPGVRTECSACGEEIINEREVVIEDNVFCQSCCGNSYYVRQTDTSAIPLIKTILTV